MKSDGDLLMRARFQGECSLQLVCTEIIEECVEELGPVVRFLDDQ